MLMPENLEMLKECVETEICVFRRGNYYTHVMIIEGIDDQYYANPYWLHNITKQKESIVRLRCARDRRQEP